MSDFEAFWPEYVRAHSHPTNRVLHVVGTSLAFACVVGAVVKRRPSLLLLAPVFGYGLGVAGHLIFEKNRPSFLSHPLYSVRANVRMWRKTLLGEMQAEVERFSRERGGDRQPSEPGRAAATTAMN